MSDEKLDERATAYIAQQRAQFTDGFSAIHTAHLRLQAALDVAIKERAEARAEIERLARERNEARAEIDRLMRDNDVARAEIRRQVWHIGLLQEKVNAKKSCACSYDNPDDVCMKHSPQLVAARAEVERLHKEHEAACLGGELLRAEIELLRRSIHD